MALTVANSPNVHYTDLRGPLSLGGQAAFGEDGRTGLEHQRPRRQRPDRRQGRKYFLLKI